MKNVKKELMNLFNSINMHDEADNIDIILSYSSSDLQEEVDYLRKLKSDAEQAERTTSGDTFLKYRHRRETLEKILFLLYIK